ncbi:murein L,D-transpeptidase catalytic domain family protein [Novosphingobium sp. KCTC 2891]|nr:murein L,D-transpeptidase catalytic domain family protein [Novosphingobium sp. KCTC 2891]
MTKAMNRRAVLTGAAITAAAAALPARVFAQPYSISEQHRRVLDVARARVEQYRPSLWRTDIVGVADFALPSSLPRLHFADLEKGEVRSFLVAHGKGSDPEHDGFLKLFSNEPGSLATSRGGFITYEWYKGKYGTSIRLGGMDPDNSHVLDRAIVLHPAWYANPDMLEKWGKLGRSDGCFAMAEADFNEALWHLSGGRLLFADRLGIY